VGSQGCRKVINSNYGVKASNLSH